MQLRQLDEFTLFWYVPALQAVHADAPPPEYFPVGHTVQENIPAPAEYRPARQATHALVPLTEYVPGKQLAHDADDAALDVAR